MCTRGSYAQAMARIVHVSDRRRSPFRAKKAFELTDRDRLLFDWLVAFQVLTRDHIARLWGINHSGTSKRLRELREQGYIEDNAVLASYPHIITVTRKASKETRWTRTTEAGNVVGVFSPPRVASASALTHTLLVTDIAVTMAVYGHAVVSERVMRHHDRSTRSIKPHYAIDQHKYYCDFLIVPPGKDPNAVAADPAAVRPRPEPESDTPFLSRDGHRGPQVREIVPKVGLTCAVEVERTRKTTARYRALAAMYDRALDGSTTLPIPIQKDPLARWALWYVADNGTRTRIRSCIAEAEKRRLGRSTRSIARAVPLTSWLAPPMA